MPIKRIDIPSKWQKPKICRHPEHNPPSMMVLEPGVYEHTCPGCGNKFRFVVPEKPVVYEHTCPGCGNKFRFVVPEKPTLSVNV